MSKVTAQLDFLWEKRVSDMYQGLKEEHDFQAMEVVQAVLKHLGLTVEGIEE